MLCIQEELGQLGLSGQTGEVNLNPTTGVVVEVPGINKALNGGVDVGPQQQQWGHGGHQSAATTTTAANKPAGWMDGLLGCMKPVFSLIGKAAPSEIKCKPGRNQLKSNLCVS